MSKIVEFKIPTTDGTETARGAPAVLKVGNRKVRFILQQDEAGEARWLTHFASGYKFGRLDDAATELACRLSPYHRFSKRQLAEFLIQKAVARIGVEKVLATLDKAPVIN